MGPSKTIKGWKDFQKIVNILKKQKFSVLIDESADISSVKNICICVRCFGEVYCQITSNFVGLIQSNEDMTAATIYDKLINSFQTVNIPFDNVVGFGSDGCNTMFGEHNTVVSRLILNFPGIIVQKCISLQLYFEHRYLEHRLQSSECIYKSLHDPETKLFF
uniref:E3 SUMO-protein ligase KIAA1586-like n=1 Tax=Diabrotica virgifera virgifera TaxID=50390 RepID=A0A6P7GSQ5_DIAVI